MSAIAYSVSNFSKVKNTLSGRNAMLLEDKYLLRKRELPEKIVLKQIKCMNLPVFQKGCYHLQPSQLY